MSQIKVTVQHEEPRPPAITSVTIVLTPEQARKFRAVGSWRGAARMATSDNAALDALSYAIWREMANIPGVLR